MTDFRYELKIQTQSMGWITMATYPAGFFNAVIEACDRCVMVNQMPCKVVVKRSPKHLEEIVYERFYNQTEDPDENWRDDEQDEEESSLDWRDSGF